MEFFKGFLFLRPHRQGAHRTRIYSNAPPRLRGRIGIRGGPVSRVLRRSKFRFYALPAFAARAPSRHCSSSPQKNTSSFFGGPFARQNPPKSYLYSNAPPRLRGRIGIRDGPVSRVLSGAAIYLGLPSPIGSSVIRGPPRAGNPMWRDPKLASDGVYMARGVTVPSVSSCLAFPPYPHRPHKDGRGCLFLLHFP